MVNLLEPALLRHCMTMESHGNSNRSSRETPYAASFHRQCEYDDGDTFGPHAERDTSTNA